jgi:hypothetical protein
MIRQVSENKGSHSLQSDRASDEAARSAPDLDLHTLLEKMERRLVRIEEAITNQSVAEFRKEWYSIAEAAEILGRAPFTVREWARHGRVNALKRPSGRGKSKEWMISCREIERIQNKGLLPSDL